MFYKMDSDFVALVQLSGISVMAINLFGTVYFRDAVAGTLQQVPDGRYSFTYNEAYLASGLPQIAFTLGRGAEPIYSEGLHPFFDNLVAEGWLARAQARALGINADGRFARLLAFGRDCPGAVSVRDPRPTHEPDLHEGTAEEIAALTNRASISGVQPKLFAVMDGDLFRPARTGEMSTHIAKLPSAELPDIVQLEYLTTIAAKALLPEDQVVDVDVAGVQGIQGPCLLVRRFDRPASGERIHFEEFNQLRGMPADAKYEGAYADIAQFISANQFVRREEDVDRLFRRVLVCVLLGNNDGHAKNFGEIYSNEGLRLAPFYDIVAAALYDRFKDGALALRIGPGTNPRSMFVITGKHIQILASSFGLGEAALRISLADLKRRIPVAYEAIEKSAVGAAALKDRLREFMRKRWNGTFESIGKR
jgi:serine/threonine-protein kinase HipA